MEREQGGGKKPGGHEKWQVFGKTGSQRKGSEMRLKRQKTEAVPVENIPSSLCCPVERTGLHASFADERSGSAPGHTGTARGQDTAPKTPQARLLLPLHLLPPKLCLQGEPGPTRQPFIS